MFPVATSRATSYDAVLIRSPCSTLLRACSSCSSRPGTCRESGNTRYSFKVSHPLFLPLNDHLHKDPSQEPTPEEVTCDTIYDFGPLGSFVESILSVFLFEFELWALEYQRSLQAVLLI